MQTLVEVYFWGERRGRGGGLWSVWDCIRDSIPAGLSGRGGVLWPVRECIPDSTPAELKEGRGFVASSGLYPKFNFRRPEREGRGFVAR
jgi:hypothetical protein